MSKVWRPFVRSILESMICTRGLGLSATRESGNLREAGRKGDQVPTRQPQGPLCDKLQPRFFGNNPRVVSHLEQAPHGLAALWSIVQSALVHIHADELVGQFLIEIAGELHGVGQG